MLEAAALSDEKFPGWAKNYVLLNHITTKIDGQKNDDLLGKKGGTGFPHLVFLDSEGNVVTKQGGRAVADFETTGNKVRTFLDLKKKMDAGDTTVKVEFTLVSMDLAVDTVTLDDAKKKIADLGELTKEQKARADVILIDVEVYSILKSINRNNQQTRLDAGKAFLEMKKAGRIPKADSTVQPFHIIMMDYFESQKDAAGYEEALKALEKFRADPNTKTFFAARDKKLAELKAANEKK